jgi:hypothetical protein
LLILVCPYIVWKVFGHYDVEVRKFQYRDQLTVNDLLTMLFGPEDKPKTYVPKQDLLQAAEAKGLFTVKDKVNVLPFFCKKKNKQRNDRRKSRRTRKKMAGESFTGTSMLTTSIALL